jgi:hypothetical protein
VGGQEYGAQLFLFGSNETSQRNTDHSNLQLVLVVAVLIQILVKTLFSWSSRKTLNYVCSD